MCLMPACLWWDAIYQVSSPGPPSAAGPEQDLQKQQPKRTRPTLAGIVKATAAEGPSSKSWTLGLGSAPNEREAEAAVGRSGEEASSS